MAKPKSHWAIQIDDTLRHPNAWKGYAGGLFVKACGRKYSNSAFAESASEFVSSATKNPDWYCATCTTKARLAMAKESAPKPTSRCATSGCGSYAINPGQSGRDHSDLNLCDVCYWRKRATETWPTPRPISEAPKDGSMVLICLPASKPQWTMGVFARTHWVDLCLVDAIVEPTHFLPLPPEVR